VDQVDPSGIGGEDLPAGRERRRVAIDADQPGTGSGREQRPGVARAAQGAIDINPVISRA
jgi:hypothetical protein